MDLPLLDWESSDTTYTALLISCKDNTGAVHSRAEWLEIMREQFKLPFTIGLPCGKTITCKTLEDIPLEDLPCPCGDPNHWLIRWETTPPSYTTTKSNVNTQELNGENPWTF